MPHKIFFQSSLPKTGSTLLQNIFGQNPLFYTSPTSGLLELIYTTRVNFTNLDEFKEQNPNVMKRAFLNFCKYGIFGYYNAITNKPIVLDKNRGWSIHFNLLNQILEEKPKIICMVRDLRQIIASMEKNYRNNYHKHLDIIDHKMMTGTSLLKRTKIWLKSNPLGLALERLKDIIDMDIHRDILIVRYEDLLVEPDGIMRLIYNYLELPYFEHNFKNIEQSSPESLSPNSLQSLSFDFKDILNIETIEYIEKNFAWYFRLLNYPFLIFQNNDYMNDSIHSSIHSPINTPTNTPMNPSESNVDTNYIKI